MTNFGEITQKQKDRWKVEAEKPLPGCFYEMSEKTERTIAERLVDERQESDRKAWQELLLVAQKDADDLADYIRNQPNKPIGIVTGVVTSEKGAAITVKLNDQHSEDYLLGYKAGIEAALKLKYWREK